MLGINKIIPADTNYPFMDYRKIFIISSLILILSSVLLLSFKGLNLGIDFKGGTLIQKILILQNYEEFFHQILMMFHFKNLVILKRLLSDCKMKLMLKVLKLLIRLRI